MFVWQELGLEVVALLHGAGLLGPATVSSIPEWAALGRPCCFSLTHSLGSSVLWH